MASPELVLETLLRATSQQVPELKAAETLLADWETKPGFYTVLLQVITDHSLQPNVRWMAALTFKNGVDRYWRKTAPNAISEEEKYALRCGLMTTFNEPVSQVAIQLAVLIAKAARFDFPREWPDLLSSLMNVVMEADQPLRQHRALLVLHHVIKTLASKRLVGDRKIFHDVTGQLFGCMVDLSNSATEAFIVQVQANDPGCQGTLEKALLTFQILRKLTIFGFSWPTESQQVHGYVLSLFPRIQSLLLIRPTLSKNEAMTTTLEKAICLLVKILLGLLETHPISFVPFVQPTLSMITSILFSSQGDGLLFPKLVILSMSVMKIVLTCPEYQAAKVRDDEPPAITRVNEIKAQFFQPAVVSEVINALISRYMLLTQEELEMWDSDPEEFECECAGEAWRYKLRSSIEALYRAIVRDHRVIVIPILQQLVYSNHQPVAPHDLQAVLRKDAVYLAIGLVAFDLYGEIDMDEWFKILQVEMAIKEGHYRIIRRRAVWLLSSWSGVKLDNELRPELYRCYLSLLHGEEDMVVRLTAANALKTTIDDFEFDVETFMEFLESSVSLLFNLLREAKECETKMHVLTVLSFIVERVGTGIKPYAGALMRYLPLLWEESAEHNMLRCAIVSTLVHCLRATVTEEISAFMYPVLNACLDMSQEAHMYLMDDGLDLWLAVVEYSQYLSPPMLHLLKYMPNILETSTEHLQPCSLILQAYVLLAPSLFFEEYGNKIFHCCYDLLNDLKPEGLVMVYGVIDMCLRKDPQTTLQMAMPIIREVFLRVYNNQEYPMVTASILSILSRVVLHSLEAFSLIISEISQTKNETAEACLQKILRAWIERMGYITTTKQQKLLALALASLMSADSAVVVNQLPDILRNLVSVLHDIVDEDPNGRPIDTLVLAGEIQEEMCAETEHEKRLNKLGETDPVYKIDILQFLKNQMEILTKRIGEDSMRQIVQFLDADTAEGLELLYKHWRGDVPAPKGN